MFHVPEYQPRGPGELVGYSDMRLSPNRYRVLSGSASTPDEAEICGARPR
jgi:hypothetical protein